MTVLGMPRRARPAADRRAGVARAGDHGRSPGGTPRAGTPSLPGGRKAPRTQRWSDVPALAVARPAADVVRVVAASARRGCAGRAPPAGRGGRAQRPAGGTSGVLDSRALDELQQRAARGAARASQAQQGEVAAARRAMTKAEQAVAAAQKPWSTTPRAARRLPAGRRRLRVRALPRRGRAHAADPAAVAGATRATSSPRWASSTSSTPTRPRSSVRPRPCGGGAGRAAAGRARRWTRAGAARPRSPPGVPIWRRRRPRSPTSSTRRSSDVDKQLAQLQKEQSTSTPRTAANWQAYVDQLTAAGVVPAAGARSWRTPRPVCRAGWCRSPRRRRERSAGWPSCRASPRRCSCCPAETLSAVARR